MTHPGITVVIPLFNKQPFVERCLRSIAGQSVLPDEVIVVNDGSTDAGPQLVAAFEGLPIRLIHQDNAGVSAARNRGVHEARHDWVAFLDADDEYLPDAIENFCAARAACPEASVVFGQSVDTGAVPAAPARTPAFVPVPDYFAYLVDQRGHEAHTSSLMVRKQAITQAGLFPPGVKIGEDTDTWLRLGCLFTFVRIDAPVAFYHLQDGDSGWETQQCAIPFWYATYETWRDAGRITEPRRRSAARNFEFSKLQKVALLARTGQRAEAFRRFFLTIRYRSAPKGLLVKTLLIALVPSILDRLQGKD